jgi:vacuolar-type H+-ATPase subunit I/STV1
MKYAIAYSARLLALVATTIAGFFFLGWFGLLMWQWHEMPGIITREDVIVTAVLGVVFVCLGVLYAFLARRTPSKRLSSVTSQS